jgi:hypothetical protein
MRTLVLIRKLLGVSAAAKSRAGFLTATVAAVTLGCKIALTEYQGLRRYSAVLCFGLGLAGFIVWGAGWWSEARRSRLARDQETPADQLAAENPLAFLRSSKYWGIILLISAAMVTGVVTYRNPRPMLTVYARTSITNIVTLTNIVTITNQKPAVTFPALELAGVVINGAHSSAVINGRVLRIGEMLGSVSLVGVDPGHAMVVLEGETNVLVLRK